MPADHNRTSDLRLLDSVAGAAGVPLVSAGSASPDELAQLAIASLERQRMMFHPDHRGNALDTPLFRAASDAYHAAAAVDLRRLFNGTPPADLDLLDAAISARTETLAAKQCLRSIASAMLWRAKNAVSCRDVAPDFAGCRMVIEDLRERAHEYGILRVRSRDQHRSLRERTFDTTREVCRTLSLFRYTTEDPVNWEACCRANEIQELGKSLMNCEATGEAEQAYEDNDTMALAAWFRKFRSSDLVNHAKSANLLSRRSNDIFDVSLFQVTHPDFQVAQLARWAAIGFLRPTTVGASLVSLAKSLRSAMGNLVTPPSTEDVERERVLLPIEFMCSEYECDTYETVCDHLCLHLDDAYADIEISQIIPSNRVRPVTQFSAGLRDIHVLRKTLRDRSSRTEFLMESDLADVDEFRIERQLDERLAERLIVLERSGRTWKARHPDGAERAIEPIGLVEYYTAESVSDEILGRLKLPVRTAFDRECSISLHEPLDRESERQVALKLLRSPFVDRTSSSYDLLVIGAERSSAGIALRAIGRLVEVRRGDELVYPAPFKSRDEL